jgi:hypothetical protein
MTIRRFSPSLLLVLLTLAACADDRRGYPSLAPRPIERAVLRVQPAPATAAVEPPPISSASDIAQLVASARTADTAFKAALDQARPDIAAGRAAAEGSEAWVVGQQALSNAVAERAPVAQALSELDKRRQAAVAAGHSAEEAAIADAAQQVEAIDEAERALLDAVMPS